MSRTATREGKTKIRTNAAQSTDVKQSRRLKLPAYRRFRFKRIPYPERLPSVWLLSRKTAALMWRNHGIFLGIAAVYAILSIVFVNSLSSTTDASTIKETLGKTFGTTGEVAAGIAVFSSLITSGSGVNTAAGAYQFVIVLVMSLAVIWATRQVLAGHKVRLRDPFYQGMYPLVPFIMVLGVVFLQALPFVIGGWFFSTIMSNGIAVYFWEKLVLFGILLALTWLTVYMLCGSLFALYIVTIPGMTPLKALRSARQLVLYRRGQVFRKLLYLPVALVCLGAVVMVPVILFAVSIAQATFFVLSILALIAAHVYLYTIYKELLA